MVFDVLWLDGHSTCELPYTDRRALLERLGLAGPAWQTPPTDVRRPARTCSRPPQQLGLEGVVAKRRDSTYLPGKRADAWRKVKPTRGQELVVGGWLPGAGRLERRLGSLLVGYHDMEDGRDVLRFAGRVGSGIDGAQRDRARDAAAAVAASDVARSSARPASPTPCGWNRRWWWRSRSTSGRVPASCARRATAAYATTNPRPTSYARPDRSQYRPAVTDDLAVLDATAQAALVRDGAVSPRELVDAALGAHRRGEPAAQRGDPPSRRARPRRGRRARRTVRSAACRCW